MADKKEAKKVKRPGAIKRDMQNEKRRDRNKAFKSEVRTITRAFEESLTSKDQSKAKTALNDLFSAMDLGVKRGLFKVNKASRTKARAVAKVSALKN